MYQRMVREHFLVFATLFVVHSTASPLHGKCFSNEDCGTIDTYCKNGVCMCKPNFAVWYDSCIQLTNPKISCTRKHECQSILGVRSICTRNLECACKPFHHLYNGQCVKNRDLYDICEHDFQCYCGEGCEDKIACIGRNCTCKTGNKAFRSRRCVSTFVQSSTTTLLLPDAIFIVTTLLIRFLY